MAKGGSRPHGLMAPGPGAEGPVDGSAPGPTIDVCPAKWSDP